MKLNEEEQKLLQEILDDVPAVQEAIKRKEEELNDPTTFRGYAKKIGFDYFETYSFIKNNSEEIRTQAIKQRGRKKGKFIYVIRKDGEILYNGTLAEIAKEMGVCETTVYNNIKRKPGYTKKFEGCDIEIYR